jgi:hypothetical protein
LDSCRPIFNAPGFPISRVNRLENNIMPVASIALAETLLGHFLATFFVHFRPVVFGIVHVYDFATL